MKTFLPRIILKLRIKQILIIGNFAVVGKKSLSEDASKRKKWKELALSDEWKGRGVSEILALEVCFNLSLFVLLT